MGPKVSVVMPVYNGENSISIPLKSLIKQTYSNFEVVIIDDGSIDASRGISERYISIDNRFKYYFQPNRGVSVARNNGIKFSQGEYICFLDSDDFYENSYIEEMVKQIEKESADICYCGYNIVSPKGITKKRIKFKSRNILVDYILGKASIHTTGWMIRKSTLEEFNIKFLEGVSWGEDFEFFCEILARVKNVTYVKKYLTNYRVDYDDNRLSALSMDKLDKDFESIQRIHNNIIINSSSIVENALIEYRLPALLTYRLLLAIKSNVGEKEISNYYKKYQSYFKLNSWNNGIRSIKLNLNMIKLKIFLPY